MQRTESQDPVARGVQGFAIDAVPVAAVTSGDTVATAWGDGRLRVFRPGAEPVVTPVHKGAILSLSPEAGGAILTGGDDGRFCRVTPGGVMELAAFPRGWVDHVAAGSGGIRACSVGREVHLAEPAEGPGAVRHEVLLAPSTVGGLAFDSTGGRLAVAHYGGVTIWTRGQTGWTPAILNWAGSHTAVCFSPDDRFVMTRMQENSLHGWRLRNRTDLSMSGFPTKVKGWAWAGTRPWLATTGADEAILWPFDGKNGPMGRTPLQIAWGGRGYVTAICAVPGHAAVLAGYNSGAVVFSEIDEKAEPRSVKPPNGIGIALLAVTPQSGWVLVADDQGGVLWAPLGGG